MLEGWASCRCFPNRDAEFWVWKAVILMSSLMSLGPSRWKRWHLMSYCSGTSPNQDWQSSFFFHYAAYWGMFSSLVCCFFSTGRPESGLILISCSESLSQAHGSRSPRHRVINACVTSTWQTTSPSRVNELANYSTWSSRRLCDWCDPRSDLWPAKLEAVVRTGADVYLSAADSQSEGRSRHQPRPASPPAETAWWCFY